MEKKEDSNLIISQYVIAVKEIKNAIIDSRYRAARFVNKEVLSLYYWVGNYVSVNSRIGKWNTNAISVISKLLQQELPGLTGFSETNIKNMRIFYEAWCHVLNNKSINYNSTTDIEFKDLLNRQMASADLNDNDWECFLNVGFSNHREIIRKTSTLEERLFYIRRCAKEFWNDYLSLFSCKKEKQKKLAALDKSAKIMILSLNKKNLLRSDSFLFLTLQTHNFLTRFLQGGRDFHQEQRFCLNTKVFLLVVLWSSKSSQLLIIVLEHRQANLRRGTRRERES